MGFMIENQSRQEETLGKEVDTQNMKRTVVCVSLALEF